MGGKLSLKAKGIPVKAKKAKKAKKTSRKQHEDGEDGEVAAKKSTSKKVRVDDDVVLVPMGSMTEAQKKHAKFKSKREEEDIRKQASKTYRERVEEYSTYLGNLTEHHDVPRVSAAGNG
ncbi:hypothetical protein SDRG_09343 [Saprolegnia diclina VS20]|uniref:DUF1754-domain-containing protein n=1 Tax=Saprolegnia diclina (strain VS20) TaxID=1156394 RepID=T0QGP9_SAPDV|nr:hypothetical protein SDRG_09343 [Saprolegnia diclina VS20]EQC32805.1 hypothetical protein SDRG_09343 [Saprolegnia diclina VS20]|eukprot:XP_008613491.1 hypothetical protein SDRG_09343 [Saprolegnia diclina VS20]